MAFDGEPRDSQQEGGVSEPPPEEPYELEGTEPAWEPSTLPGWPLTAAEAAPFVRKVIA